MGRGRKSRIEELSGPSVPGQAPPPPDDLIDPDARDAWLKITNSLPYDWFPGECLHLLVCLCEHIAYRGDCAARAAALHERLSEGDDKAQRQTMRLWFAALRAYDQQTDRITSLSGKLKLTKASQYLRRSEGAGSARANAGVQPTPPWEDWGNNRRRQ